jgi:hypothetical protein
LTNEHNVWLRKAHHLLKYVSICVERKVTWWRNKWRLLTFCTNSLLFFYREQINLHDIDFLLRDYRIRLTRFIYMKKFYITPVTEDMRGRRPVFGFWKLGDNGVRYCGHES